MSFGFSPPNVCSSIERARSNTAGTRQVPETFQRDPKIVQVSGNIWVLRAKGVFVDTLGTLAGSFRVAKLAQ